MHESTPPTQDPEIFRAVLHANRSLSPEGFVILMAAIGAVSFITGLAFLMVGAWPVMGFFGLDVLLIYIAFRLNYRDGRAYELVELTPSRLTLKHVSAVGEERAHEFNPYWVRLLFSERHDGSVRLALSSHGREVEFGSLLSDEERREFAGVLNQKLGNARGGMRP